LPWHRTYRQVRLKSAALGLAALVALAGCAGKPALRPLSSGGAILCFGDSLTFGTGASSGASYPERLAALTGREVVSRGVPGETSAEGLARLPSALDETRPELVVICHGANDILRNMSLDAAASNLEAMVRLAQSRGAQVVLLGVPRPGVFLRAEPFYAAVAKKTGVPLEARALPKVLADGSMKSDLIHPNDRGYDAVARDVADLLRRRGALPAP
jgi:lysophospholipase L1-like esterase